MRLFPRHSIGVFENTDEQVALVREYFLTARRAGNQIALFLHDEDRGQFLSRLDCPDLNLERGIADGWFLFGSARDIYMPTGVFLIPEMYERIHTVTKSALAGGYSGLSAVGDMSWSHAAGIRPAILAEYESGLDSVFEKLPLQGLCLYSKAVFDRQEIALQCVCHPSLVTPAQILANPLSEFGTNGTYRLETKTSDIHRYWEQISKLSDGIERLKGEKAVFAKKVLKSVQGLMYRKFAEEDGSDNSRELLHQIDLLTNKIEILNLAVQMS